MPEFKGIQSACIHRDINWHKIKSYKIKISIGKIFCVRPVMILTLINNFDVFPKNHIVTKKASDWRFHRNRNHMCTVFGYSIQCRSSKPNEFGWHWLSPKTITNRIIIYHFALSSVACRIRILVYFHDIQFCMRNTSLERRIWFSLIVSKYYHFQ